MGLDLLAIAPPRSTGVDCIQLMPYLSHGCVSEEPYVSGIGSGLNVSPASQNTTDALNRNAQFIRDHPDGYKFRRSCHRELPSDWERDHPFTSLAAFTKSQESTVRTLYPRS